MRGAAWVVGALAALVASEAGAVEAKIDLGSIKRELWSADVGLEQASVSLRGLGVIADDDQAYDPQVAGELRSRVVQDLRSAEQHLGRLWQVPGQDDARMRQIAALQDSMRGLRERVEKLGHTTRAGLDPRPDTRKGATLPSAHALRQASEQADEMWMPPRGSEALQDTRAELKTVWGDLQQVEEQNKQLADVYKVEDRLPQP